MILIIILSVLKKNCGDTFDGLALTELKTKRSRRKLPLSPVLRDILLEHKAILDEQSRALGSLWQENGVICPNITGGLMVKSTPNKALADYSRGLMIICLVLGFTNNCEWVVSMHVHSPD